MLQTFESFQPFSQNKFSAGDLIIYVKPGDTLSGREGEIVASHSRIWGTNDYDIKVEKGGAVYCMYGVDERNIKPSEKQIVFEIGDLVKYKKNDDIGKVTYVNQVEKNCSVLFVIDNKILIIKNSELRPYKHVFRKGDKFVFVMAGNSYNKCKGEILSEVNANGSFYSKIETGGGFSVWINVNKINMIPIAEKEFKSMKITKPEEKIVLDINGANLKKFDKVIYRNPESKYFNEIFEYQDSREDGKCEISKYDGGYKKVWVELKFLEKINFVLNDEVVYESPSGGTLNGNIYTVKSINSKGEIELERTEGAFTKKLTTDAKNLKKYVKPYEPYVKPKKKKKKVEKPKPILVYNRRNVAEREGRKRPTQEEKPVQPVVKEPIAQEPKKVEPANEKGPDRTMELKYIEYLDGDLKDGKISKDEYEEKMKELYKRMNTKS